MKRIVLLASIVLSATIAFAQNNTCAYTFTYPKYAFQFCLTASGTLAMLQSPIGVNHLDTANPIEGWTWQLTGTVSHGGDIFWDDYNVPAWGNSASLGTPTVTQPNGPGTLPIKFNWGNMWEIVSATVSERSVKLQMVIPPASVWWGGQLTRIMTPKVDGSVTNTFDRLRAGVFAYVEGGEALMMQGPSTCFGPGEISGNPGCQNTPFTGYGTFIAIRGYGGYGNIFYKGLTVTYKIF